MSVDASDILPGGLVWVDVAQPGVAADHAPARVTGRVGDELVLAVPHGSHGADGPGRGAELMLRWTTERGVQRSPASLLSSDSAGATWRVRLIGTVERVQRRQYARAPFSGPVAIVPLEARLARVVKGELADLSEGGLRAHVPGSPLTVGVAVEAHLVVDSVPAALRGAVLRSDLTCSSPPVYETVVTFTVGEAQAAMLRRIVLRRQMSERQARQR